MHREHKMFAKTCMLLGALVHVSANVHVNEVASKGSSGLCDGEDWVELYNDDLFAAAALDGMVLYDDKGASDDKAYTFPADASIGAGEYLVLCRDTTDGGTGMRLGIGKEDSISLNSEDGVLLSTSGILPDEAEEDKTWCRRTNGEWAYTLLPTPGEANQFPSYNETEDDPELVAQNSLGEWFFGMGPDGKKVAGSDAIVELHATMDPDAVTEMMANQSYEMYATVQSFKVVTSRGTTVLPHPGRIRPKGQSTLAIGTCLGWDAIPFKVDFTSKGTNQTLFGVEEGYLRNHMSDGSFMREWSMHRMLARFGLAYLRTRTVKFYINGKQYGLYSFMEAPDQQYVYQRSFPNFNRTMYALYKIKTLSNGCGAYDATQLALARATDENSTYAFERGSHRKKIAVLYDGEACTAEFFGMMGREQSDVLSAYKRFGKDCGITMTQVGLVDRDLGTANTEPRMIEFFNKHLTATSAKCSDEKCSNVDMSKYVNVDNVLKNLAVYAVTVNQDSILNNGNNWYAADPGDGLGYRIVQYDHNNILDKGVASFLCAGCDSNLVTWSIARPSCTGMRNHPMVGPLLLKPENMQKYLAHVDDFVSNVFNSQELIAEMKDHANALRAEVASDPWILYHLPGYSYTKELSPSAGVWTDDSQTPLLATMAARSASVIEQLSRLEANTFPRLPAQVGDVERCQDWTVAEAPAGWDSGVPVEDAVSCPSYVAQPCQPASACFDHQQYCGADGEFTIAECVSAAGCKLCFPKSHCGTLPLPAKSPLPPPNDVEEKKDGDGWINAPSMILLATLAGAGIRPL